jgi:hypothetical protein
MTKECYTQEFVDVEKFKECASCPIFEECTGTVQFRGARGALNAGLALGLMVGLALGIFAALRFPEDPGSSGWLLGIAFVYIAALMRAGKESAARNREAQEALLRKTEAK